MHKREAIIPAGMDAVYEKIGYAPAIKVGDTVYVSVQIGRDAAMQLVADREAQIVQAFENLKRVLEAGGATLDDVFVQLVEPVEGEREGSYGDVRRNRRAISEHS